VSSTTTTGRTAVAAPEQGPFRYHGPGLEQRCVCRHDREPQGIDALVATISGVLS